MTSNVTLQYVLLLLYVVIVTSFDLTIMHTNHIQAHFEEFDSNGLSCDKSEAEYRECFGGVARRLTKVEEIRDSQPNSLLFDGGDHFQGTQWYTYYRGNATAHFMNWIRYDAMAPSNHEFDDGPENFGRFLEKVEFPVVSCNMDAINVPEMQGLFHKSVVFEMDGERIGIVGYTTTDANVISAPGALEISDEISALTTEVDRLTADGVNKIIVLGTSGLQKETEIAQNVEGVDVIIGADHHQFLYTGTPPTTDEVTGPYPTVIRPSEEKIVLIVQTSNFGEYLGYLQVTFDDNGEITNYNGNPILLDSSIEQDEDTLAEVNKWAIPVGLWGERQIGESYAFLDGANPSCRAYECNLGNLVADAYLWDHVTFQDDNGWSDVSIAFINSGGLRSSIPAGPIKYSDVTTVTPFGETIDLIELRGHHIREILERSVEEYDLVILPGFFLQFTGLRVSYDLSQPIGNRVASVDVVCTYCSIPVYEPLDVEKVYKVVMQAYLIEGGDGYTMIKDNVISHKIGREDAEILADYLTKHSPIAPGIEGRITFVGTGTGAAPSVQASLVAFTLTLIIQLFL